jgi:tetratricopeptide (TPR) repeat protein
MSADLNLMGNILFESGKYDEANNKYEESLNKILKSDQSDANKNNSKRFSLYNDARIALMKGDLKTAKSKSKELLQKAGDAKNNFQMWLAHEVNGMIAMHEKNFKKAIEEFKNANMQNPYTYYRLAMAYDASGDKGEAQKYYKEAANFNALNNVNQAFIRLKAQKMISSM